MADSLPAQDGGAVVQHWQQCWEATMKEGNLVVISACPCTEPTPSIQRARLQSAEGASKRKWHILPSRPIYLESISSAHILTLHDWKSTRQMILTVMQFAVWPTDYRAVYNPGGSAAGQKCTSRHWAADCRGSLCSPCSAGSLPV